MLIIQSQAFIVAVAFQRQYTHYEYSTLFYARLNIIKTTLLLLLAFNLKIQPMGMCMRKDQILLPANDEKICNANQ